MNVSTYNLACEIMAKIAAHEWGGVTDIAEAIDKHYAAHDDAIRRECAKAARNAIFDFGIGDKASNYYSPTIRKELAVQIVERAILGAEPVQVMRDLDPKVADCVQKNFSELIATEPAREESE